MKLTTCPVCRHTLVDAYSAGKAQAEDTKAERIRAAEVAALDMIPEALSEAQYAYEGKPFCSGCHRAWDGEHKGNCGFGMLKTAYANLHAARGA